RLPSIERLHEDLVDLHGPLHRSLGVGHPHLLDGDDSPAACWERSDHLLSGADRSCTPDSCSSRYLTGPLFRQILRRIGATGVASEMMGRMVPPLVEPTGGRECRQ